MDGSLLFAKFLNELNENGHDWDTASLNDQIVALMDAVAPYLHDHEEGITNE